MKKLYVYVALAAMGVMAACSKNDNVDPQGNGGNTVIDDNSPVAVELGVRGVNMGVDVTSKAQGSINTAWNGKQKLYVYAIDRSDATFANTPLIDNVSAMSPASGNTGTLNLVDGDGEYFYFQGSTVYDFYGYYVDDAAQTTPGTDNAPTRDGGTITLPITITGAQDIMLAKADPQSDIDAAKEASAQGANEVTAETAYSAFAARRGVQPTLEFNHQLARFTFNIKPGSASGAKVTVTAIELESNTTGTLQIAPVTDVTACNIQNPASPAYLKLMDADETSGVKDFTAYDVPTYTGADQEAVKVGESLMVIPGVGSYKLKVSMTQEGNTPGEPLDVAALETVIDATKVTPEEGAEGDLTTFEAGKTYDVTIIVYGMEQIEVTAELKDWEDGGSVVIDPDQDMIPGQDDEEEVVEPEP